MTVKDKFESFNVANPHVYGLFKKFAAQAIRAGVKRMSSKLIIERIRWETMVTTTGAGWSATAKKPFKLDNRFTAHYSRKFMDDYPGAGEFFETRVIKTP
jgi:hypothetical protein